MSTKDLVYIALFAALMAALSLFPRIEMPIVNAPITAQSMGPMLAGGIIGARRGGLSMILFLILVAAGLPLLAGGKGGIGALVGPTAGFIVGWVVGAWVVGYLTEKYWPGLNAVKAFAICVVGGIAVVYLFGLPWLAYATHASILKVAVGLSVFVPGDIAKAVIAAAVMIGVKRAYPIAGPADAGGDAA